MKVFLRYVNCVRGPLQVAMTHRDWFVVGGTEIVVRLWTVCIPRDCGKGFKQLAPHAYSVC